MNFLKKSWKEAPKGEIVPAGKRRAWHEPQRHVGVYTAMLLHWVARILRELHHRVTLAATAPTIEQDQAFELRRAHQARERLAEEYSKGYMAGWHECFEVCRQAVEEEVTNSDEVWKMGALLTSCVTTQREN
jgi:hypothetical protein